jgi:hypothetical protein
MSNFALLSLVHVAWVSTFALDSSVGFMTPRAARFPQVGVPERSWGNPEFDLSNLGAPVFNTDLLFAFPHFHFAAVLGLADLALREFQPFLVLLLALWHCGCLFGSSFPTALNLARSFVSACVTSSQYSA